MNVATIAKDGMLIVKHTDPFSPTVERIIVPTSVLPGLVAVLHIKLGHPTQYQMKQVISRYFYALNLDYTIQQTNKGCHTCAYIIHNHMSNPIGRL